MTLNIQENRHTVKYSTGEMVLRILWMVGERLVTFSPRPCFGWRRLILRRFGAQVAAHVHTYPSTRVYFPWNLTVGAWTAIGENAFIYDLGPITIGQKVTISHGVHLCAGSHDYRKPDMPLLKPPIEIKDQVWLCADAFVGPGVVIGEGAVVGARAVVTKHVEPWTVVAGNPARFIRRREMERE